MASMAEPEAALQCRARPTAMADTAASRWRRSGGRRTTSATRRVSAVVSMREGAAQLVDGAARAPSHRGRGARGRRHRPWCVRSIWAASAASIGHRREPLEGGQLRTRWPGSWGSSAGPPSCRARVYRGTAAGGAPATAGGPGQASAVLRRSDRSASGRAAGQSSSSSSSSSVDDLVLVIEVDRVRGHVALDLEALLRPRPAPTRTEPMSSIDLVLLVELELVLEVGSPRARGCPSCRGAGRRAWRPSGTRPCRSWRGPGTSRG